MDYGILYNSHIFKVVDYARFTNKILFSDFVTTWIVSDR